MEKAAEEFAAAREEIREVRDELAKRPTRRQIGWVLVAIVAALLVLGVVAYLTLRSSSSASDSADAAAATKLSQDIQGCRAIVRTRIVDTATNDFNLAYVARDAARDERDNLTNEAVQAAAEGNDAKFRLLSAQAGTKRQAVTDANETLQDKADAYGKAVDEYQGLVDQSQANPEDFLREQCPDS